MNKYQDSIFRISLVVLGVVSFFICIYLFYIMLSNKSASNNSLSLAVLTIYSVISLWALSLPILVDKFETLSNQSIYDFMGITFPKKKLKLSTVTSFLSDIALSCFLVTMIVLAFKYARDQQSYLMIVMFSLILVITLFLIAIIIAASYIKFVSYFAKNKLYIYYIMAILSLIVIAFIFFLNFKIIESQALTLLL